VTYLATRQREASHCVYYVVRSHLRTDPLTSQNSNAVEANHVVVSWFYVTIPTIWRCSRPHLHFRVPQPAAQRLSSRAVIHRYVLIRKIYDDIAESWCELKKIHTFTIIPYTNITDFRVLTNRNKAVIDRRLRPRCCHLGSYFKRPKSRPVRQLPASGITAQRLRPSARLSISLFAYVKNDVILKTGST